MLYGLVSMRVMPRWSRIFGGLLLTVLAGALVLAIRWPYTRGRMMTSIERATGSRVRLEHYDASYFPEPGCTIKKLTIDRHAREPIARAEKIVVRSSWLSLLTFRKRVRHIHVEGLHIQIPLPFPPPTAGGSSVGLGELVIGEFVADGTSFEIARADQDGRIRFP